MSSPHPLPERLPDRWRYALFGGAVCAAFVLLEYVQSPSPGAYSVAGLFAGGLAAGAIAARRGASAKDVGFRAGLAGFVAILTWVFFGGDVTLIDVLTESWPADANVMLMVIVASTLLGAAVTVIGIALGAAGVVGGIGGLLGGWLSRAFAGEDSPATGE